jgi:hypothetical protein
MAKESVPTAPLGAPVPNVMIRRGMLPGAHTPTTGTTPNSVGTPGGNVVVEVVDDVVEVVDDDDVVVVSFGSVVDVVVVVSFGFTVVDVVVVVSFGFTVVDVVVVVPPSGGGHLSRLGSG